MQPSSRNSISSRSSTALWITYTNIVLYALSYQLQKPVEPFLVEKLSNEGSGEIVVTYGRLQSFFSTIQTFGSPLVGILLDRIGIRLTSSIVFGSSAISYAMLSYADTMEMLFYSKIPTAFQHAFLVAQAVAATSCSGNEAARAQALGRMTTAYTLGATLGPALGGFLADHGDFYVGAKLAVLGSLISTILSVSFLPDVSLSDEARVTPRDERRTFWEELTHTTQIAFRSSLWPLLAVKVISGVASSMFQTALPMVLTQKLHFDPSALGIYMSSSMLATALFGAFGMSVATRMLGATGLARLGLIIRPIIGCCIAAIASSSFVFSFASIPNQIIGFSVLYGLAAHALATGLTTQTTGIVSAGEKGAVLGLEHGLFSLARIGGPAIGTKILTSAGIWTVAISCGTIDMLMVSLLMLTYSKVGRKTKSRIV